MVEWEWSANAQRRSKLLHVCVSLRNSLDVSAAAWPLSPGTPPIAARTLCPKPGANTPTSSSPPCVSITFAALRSPCTTPAAQHNRTDRRTDNVRQQREASQQAAVHSTNTAYRPHCTDPFSVPGRRTLAVEVQQRRSDVVTQRQDVVPRQESDALPMQDAPVQRLTQRAL